MYHTDSSEPSGPDFATLYAELRRIARAEFVKEGAAHTLQPTAVAHEAYLRLAREHRRRFRGDAHFLSVAARTMREILVDHARRRRTVKRGSSARRLPIEEAFAVAETRDEIVLPLDEALGRLERFDERMHRIVELRFFAGLQVPEIARTLGVSTATVKRDWAVARAWLQRELARGE